MEFPKLLDLLKIKYSADTLYFFSTGASKSLLKKFINRITPHLENTNIKPGNQYCFKDEFDSNGNCLFF